MSDITVASTTDTQEAVQQAAGLEPEAVRQGEAEEFQASDKSKSGAAGHDRIGEQTGPAESAAESETAEGEHGPHSARNENNRVRKSGVQKRIDTLTRRLYDQQEELDALRERVAQPDAELGAQRRSSDNRRPTANNYPSYEQYIEALADWKAGQRYQEQKQAELVQAEQERTRGVFDTYNEAAVAARVKYEDFEEVVGRKDLKIPQAAQAAIIEAGELGPDIAYYLGKHPELCHELAAMSPMRAVARIGQIEAKVIAKPNSPLKNKPITSAPAPITPVSGSSRKTMTPLDELPYRDYKRLRDQEERARYR